MLFQRWSQAAHTGHPNNLIDLHFVGLKLSVMTFHYRRTVFYLLMKEGSKQIFSKTFIQQSYSFIKEVYFNPVIGLETSFWFLLFLFHRGDEDERLKARHKWFPETAE